MAISWLTDGTSPGYVPGCRLGVKKGGVLALAYNGTSTMYYIAHHHSAVAVGLAPATTYYYVCGDASAAGRSNASRWTPEHSFVTEPLLERGSSPPASGLVEDSEDSVVHAVIYGDMGVTNATPTINAVRNYTANNPVAFIMHVGDMSCKFGAYPWVVCLRAHSFLARLAVRARGNPEKEGARAQERARGT